MASKGGYRMARYCEKLKLEHRLIINRVGYGKFDLERADVEKIYGDVAFQAIPEDRIVSESIFKQKPAFMIDRNSYFCLGIEDLAREYSLKVKDREQDGAFTPERETKPTILERLAKWFLRDR